METNVQFLGNEGDILLPERVIRSLALLDGDVLEFIVDKDCILLRRKEEAQQPS